MAIEFHCEHCGKLVRAADEYAGKRGKCPGCQQSVYIPTPEIEPLPFAPVDREDEQRQRELLDETRRLTETIMHERDTLPPEPPRAAKQPRPAPEGDARLSHVVMEEAVVNYAKAMAAGNLERAEELMRDIRADSRLADEVIQRIMVDEIPPAELADIPRPVLIAFFKQLREKK
jgi:phage FluMu protein Com